REEDRHGLPHLARDRLRARGDEDVSLPALAKLELALDRLSRAMADDDVARLSQTDEPRRLDDGLSHHERARAAQDHVPALERESQREAVPERSRQPIVQRECRSRRAQRVIALRLGSGAERRDERADYSPVDESSGELDLGRGLGVETIEPRGRLLGILLDLV